MRQESLEEDKQYKSSGFDTSSRLSCVVSTVNTNVQTVCTAISLFQLVEQHRFDTRTLKVYPEFIAASVS